MQARKIKNQHINVIMFLCASGSNSVQITLLISINPCMADLHHILLNYFGFGIYYKLFLFLVYFMKLTVYRLSGAE
jgi:hypothetical protein